MLAVHVRGEVRMGMVAPGGGGGWQQEADVARSKMSAKPETTVTWAVKW